jgi:hypothetical protein
MVHFLIDILAGSILSVARLVMPLSDQALLTWGCSMLDSWLLLLQVLDLIVSWCLINLALFRFVVDVGHLCLINTELIQPLEIRVTLLVLLSGVILRRVTSLDQFCG